MKPYLLLLTLVSMSVCSVPATETAPMENEAAVLRVPKRLQVEQNRDTIDVSFVGDEEIKLQTRPNLVKGTRWEASIRHGGEVKSLWGGMTSGIKLERFADILTRGKKGIPAGNEEFTYEFTVTIFETDEATGHMWAPERGKAYKVLWTRTYKDLVK